MTTCLSLYIKTHIETLIPKGSLRERVWLQKYLGSNKPTKGIKTGEIVKLAKEIVKENKDPQKIIDLADSLYSQATTFEEMHLAGCLLNRIPDLKTQAGLSKLDYWLNFTYGWAETDILCQSGWNVDLVLKNWSRWEHLLSKFAKDKNIHKRRASLVVLTSLVRNSNDRRLSALAFKNTEVLKKEKEVLITKAVSWILRSLIVNHKQEVADYLTKNKDTLPKIALRETTNKLKTGKK